MAVQKIPFNKFKELGVETRDRSFRFDLNALADFEQEVGMGLPQLLSTKSVFAGTRALMWAGFKWQDRSLSIQKMGVILQDFIEKGGDISDCLTACLEAAMEQGAIRRVKEDDGEEGGGSEGNAKVTLTEVVGSSGSTNAPQVRTGDSVSVPGNSTDTPSQS